MKILKKILSKTTRFIMVLSMIITCATGAMISVNAQTSTDISKVASKKDLTYHGPISYSGSKVGNFTIDGKQAFCMEHPKATPPDGTELTTSIYNNSNVRKVLYYGWGGPGQWSGFNGNKNYGVVATSKVLSHYYYGDGYGSVGEDFYNYIKNKTVPDFSVKFNKSAVDGYISGNIQRTETITLSSESNLFDLTIKLDDDMTYVDETNNKKQTGGSVTIKGKTKFHFEAPINVKNAQWSSGNKTSSYTFQPIIGAPRSSSYQKIASWDYVRDPEKTTSLKVNWITGGNVEFDKIVLTQDRGTKLVDESNLEGIEFTAYAKDDVVIDNETIYEAGEEVGTFYTDKSGVAVITGLPISTEGTTYVFKETKTLDGLILSEEEYEYTFTPDDLSFKLDVINDIILIEFSKTNVTGDAELEGATLTVKDDEGNIIDEWVSGKETHLIQGLTVGKIYTLSETITADGYVKAKDIQFKVLSTKEVQRVTMIDKVVTMSKVDVYGEEIEGATMQVVDEEGKIVDEWISTKEPHQIKGLEEGKSYVLHEEVVIDGYVKASDIKFDVTEEKVNQHITMVDTQVFIEKVDNMNQPVIGAVLQVLDQDGNIIDEFTTDENKYPVKGLETGKTYTLHEVSAPDNYELSEDIVFTVEDNNQNITVKMTDTKMDDVYITKYDATNMKELPGAHLEIKDKDGKIIDQWISTEEQHKVRLVVGETYTLTETIAPDGYAIAQSIEFTVEDNGKVNQQVNMLDELLPVVVKTGDDANYIYYGAASVIAAFIIILLGKKKFE